MKQLFFFSILFLPVLLFGQKKYEVFSPWDTASYHIRPGLLISGEGSTSPNYGWAVGSFSDSTRMDTIYNALKFNIYLTKRDTSSLIEIERDTIKQEGKVIGIFKFHPGQIACEIYFGKGYGPIAASAGLSDDNYYFIRTFKDNKSHKIPRTGFFELEIAEYLIKQGYL